jgi:hypothetical protein
MSHHARDQRADEAATRTSTTSCGVGDLATGGVSRSMAAVAGAASAVRRGLRHLWNPPTCCSGAIGCNGEERCPLAVLSCCWLAPCS